MGFIRTIAILIILYYAGKLFTRYVLPVFLRNYIKKMTGQTRQNQNFQKEKLKKDGEVTVDYKPGSDKKKVNKDTGDYVDFEEVE